MHPLRKLEDLDKQINKSSGYTGIERWMLPYADFLTLLLGFFVVLFAASAMEKSRLAEAHEVTQKELAEVQVEMSENQAELQELKAVLTGEPSEQSPVDPTETKAETVEAIESTIVEKLGLKAQQVNVHADSQGLVISFQDQIFFAPGEAQLSEKSKQTVDKLATLLCQTDRPIRVEGHTDNTPIKTPQYPSNWELSTARATNLVRYLMERYHFPPQQLSAAGYAEFQPIADNSTNEGKQKNRRVDIVLLNALPEPEHPDEPHSANPIKPPTLPNME